MKPFRLTRSFGWAWQGIRHAFRTQPNFRIHTAITLAVVLLGLLLRIDATRWAVLALTVALVLALEMINTAIEATVDLVTPDHHPLAKVAKDAAAGAVFVAAILAVVVGLLILGPPLWAVVRRALGV